MLKQFSRLCTYLAVMTSLFLLGACSPPQKLMGNPEFPYPPDNPQVGDLIHMATGHKLELGQMLDAIRHTRIIYVGETHDNPASHQWQLDILAGLFRQGAQLALGMEMFTPAQQPVLDRWVAGELSEKEFLREVDWFTNWRMNFALYRPLLTFCRDNRIPVLALNAPKSLVRQVGRTPLDELPQDVQDELPEFDFNDPYQRGMTEGIYAGHSMGKAMVDGFVRVQTLWDETMADNLAQYLQSPEGEGRQVVVIAGGNHVRYGFGIPRRVHRRLPTSYALVGSREIDFSQVQDRQLMDVSLPEFPMRPWDYLKLTRYEKLEKGVKLGVFLEEGEKGVSINKVMPGSAAEKAGLQAGDVLLKAGDTSLENQFDLLYLLMNLDPDAKLPLSILRDAEQIDLEVVF